MPSGHSPADDVVYNLVSIQYHALQAASLYDKYIEDAHDHEDVASFIRQCQEQDAQRAIRCHELLKELTKDHGLSGTG
jgi:hypothetical protein